MGSSLGLGEGPWLQRALWGPSLVPRDPSFAGDWPDPVLHRAAEELSPWVAALGQPRAWPLTSRGVQVSAQPAGNAGLGIILVHPVFQTEALGIRG